IKSSISASPLFSTSYNSSEYSAHLFITSSLFNKFFPCFHFLLYIFFFHPSYTISLMSSSFAFLTTALFRKYLPRPTPYLFQLISDVNKDSGHKAKAKDSSLKAKAKDSSRKAKAK